jgi:beta-glucosidase
VYVELPQAAGENFKRLAGWQRVPLAAGESKTVTVSMEKRTLSVFDVASDAWKLLPGEYRVLVGPSSREMPLQVAMKLE